MKMVITGANGFLGKEIVRQASRIEGVELIAVTTNPGSVVTRERVNVLSAEEYVSGSLELGDCQVLLNCAFPRNEDPESMALGLDYVEKVVQTIPVYGFSKVINVSSQSVYSQFREYDAVESSPIALESKYAVAKYLVEKMFDIKTNDAGVKCIHVRLASLIGPGFDQRLPNKLAKKMISGEPVEINNSGQMYGYMDVRDAAAGIVTLAVTSGIDFKRIYNLGSGRSISISEVAKTVKSALCDIANIDAKLTIKDNLATNRSNSSVCSDLFFRELGWNPVFTPSDSIKDIVRFAWSEQQEALR